MNNLGLMYQALGQYSQAEPLYVRVVDLIRRVLGDEHPNTLTATANLPGCTRCRASMREAEPLFARALAVGRRVPGEQNPNTLSTMKRLADLYRDEGKYAQAESLYHQRHGRPASSARK